MHILYIGDNHSYTTSFHRASALGRLGHTVSLCNPKEAVKGQLQASILNKIHYRTGYRFLQKKMRAWISKTLLETQKPDLIWIDSGELIGERCIKQLKSVMCPVILYNVDDPTGKRDGNRFNSLLKAIPHYDLSVVVREESKIEFLALGAKQVLLVCRSYDEEAHKPYSKLLEIPIQFKSEVVFIGTWMRHEKRDEFLLKLISAGIPISIWGNRWQKSPYWFNLKSHYRGKGLGGRNYVSAIQNAKVCLGLLSKGNRDLHTQRSLEVPYAGGLLCAERTSEHQKMYREGVEAVFWSDATECAEICKELLADDARRELIRQAGMAKVRELGVGNEDVCQRILETVGVNDLVLQNRS